MVNIKQYIKTISLIKKPTFPVFLGEPLDEAFKKVGNKAYHFGQSKVDRLFNNKFPLNLFYKTVFVLF